MTRINARRSELQQQGFARFRSLAPANTPGQILGIRVVYGRLDSAGVAGVISLTWSGGWGVNKIFGSNTERSPSVDLSCEDYGLSYRLATNNQGPRVRLSAESQATPAEVPMFDVVAELEELSCPTNTCCSRRTSIAGLAPRARPTTAPARSRCSRRRVSCPKRIPGRGAPFSWATGVARSRAPTARCPLPRTIPRSSRDCRWSSIKTMAPGATELLEAQGFAKAGGNLAKWVAQLPNELSDGLRVLAPGHQENTGSDHTSFVCRPAPAFRLQSSYPEYRQYTRHTNRDTYDKIVFDDLKQNATLAAMLVYAASEDPERVSRELSVLPPFPNGQARPRPMCGRARSSFAPASTAPR